MDSEIEAPYVDGPPASTPAEVERWQYEQELRRVEAARDRYRAALERVRDYTEDGGPIRMLGPEARAIKAIARAVLDERAKNE